MSMPFRNTNGIVSEDGDPNMEADVIMTAATLGLAASYIARTQSPIQFDMDPLDAADQNGNFDPGKFSIFAGIVEKINNTVHAYLVKKGYVPSEVQPGLTPHYEKGAVIMGVYTLAGQNAPQSVTAPVLTEAGRRLYSRIKDQQVLQYKGRGAYTGFVDNPNSEGDTNPVGPRSTARFLAPAPGQLVPDPHPRWLPPNNGMQAADVWKSRQRADDTYVPWGMIGGDSASKPPDPRQPNNSHAANLADQITDNMLAQGMVFNGDVTLNDIAAYTHGMVQAIYKAYALGPGCTPYEIAVGDVTKKMASCIPCTLFMYSLGYYPTAIHLGRGESWAPLYAPYNPNDRTEENESGVIRDLNNAWYENCLRWLTLGLQILDDSHINANHKSSRDAVMGYLFTHAANAFKDNVSILDAADPFNDKSVNLDAPDYTVGGVLILDALTIHKPEQDRINSTLVTL